LPSTVVEQLLDFLLPETDRGVFIQWIVMGVVWIVALVASRGWRREYRLFVFGLVMINFAWFAVRTAH
jgi:hypothetical protein